MLLVAPLGRMDVVEIQRLFIQGRQLIGSQVFPCGDVGKMLVVAKGFAVGGLILFPEMTAAAFVAMQRVAAHQLREFEKIGYAAGLFKLLIPFLAGAANLESLP